MIKTNTLRRNYDPNSLYPKSSKSYKWNNILKDIWKNRKYYEGSGVIVVPSDPNALLGRLDLLLSSKEAGHTGVVNKKLILHIKKLKMNEKLEFNRENYEKYNTSRINVENGNLVLNGHVRRVLKIDKTKYDYKKSVVQLDNLIYAI